MFLAVKLHVREVLNKPSASCFSNYSGKGIIWFELYITQVNVTHSKDVSTWPSHQLNVIKS